MDQAMTDRIRNKLSLHPKARDKRGNWSHLQGVHPDIFGNPLNIRGDVSNIRGDISNIQGDVSNIQGDVSGIEGDVSGIEGGTDEIMSILDSHLKE